MSGAVSLWNLPPDQMKARLAQLASAAPSAEVIPFPSRAVTVRPRTKAPRFTFRGFDDFMPALRAARQNVIRYGGERWYLNPALCIKARVPAAWVRWKGLTASGTSPRDLNFPLGPYWPGGALPFGPEYAAPCHVAQFALPPPPRQLTIEAADYELIADAAD
jgi:hypothetical protein